MCDESGPLGAGSLPPCLPLCGGSSYQLMGRGWRITNCLWKVGEVFLVITYTKSAGALCNWDFTLQMNRGVMASEWLPDIV